MKHAYLILAHNEFTILQALISKLDDPRNDIYIHFDKKVKEIPRLIVSQSKINVLSNRVSVFWGDFSMVEAEYVLFETAVSNGPYQYYHLLSGVDLPLKSQNNIHLFFNENNGKEFIGYSLLEMNDFLQERLQRWYIFPHEFRKYWGLKRYLRIGLIRIQEALHILRNKDIDFKKGSQWVSITDNMARYLISKKKWVFHTFRHTFCSDESFIQTLCWESPFKQNIFSLSSDKEGCKREIGWRDNNQLIDWDFNDFNTLKNSDALFARKFNSKDMTFINRVLKLSE